MRRAVLATFVLLLVAGCGGDDEGGGAAPPASSSGAAETRAPDEASGGPAVVTIVDFEFDPLDLKVQEGAEVSWVNDDSANHNVIFDGDAAENIDNLSQDQKGSVTFEQAGTFKYVCSYHPGMEGSVVVQ